MPSSMFWLLSLVPVLPALAGLLSFCRPADRAVRLARRAVTVTLVLAVFAAAALAFAGPTSVRWSPFGADAAFHLSLRLDGISAGMVLLVSYLGWVVVRFAGTYLAGDPHQARFMAWLLLTCAAVLTLVLAGNLLLLWAAWVATSLFLHRLLLHYPERAGAIFAARKKFIVSRLGDTCFALALALIYRAYGTWELDALFAAVRDGHIAGLPLIGVCLAACAALKSAQFPFHSWLPDTMETPTPVSALMHAGIINAGGFLVVRLSPLFVHAPAALTGLAVLGTITAAFGALVMLTQPSVKRALAYSTIAQMGFMMLQCGLGAFGLALLHLVAHSLYKAHAFLHAGSTIGAVPRAAIPLNTPALIAGLVAAGLIVTGSATALAFLVPALPRHLGLFAAVLTLSLAYGLARLWSTGRDGRTIRRGLVVAAGIALASLALHTGASALFASLPVVTPSALTVAFAAVVFTGLFIGQALIWRAGHHALGRRLYVHAVNGFYIGTLANRWLSRLWPRHRLA